MKHTTPATAEEVAALYGVHKSTVHRWIEDGQFRTGTVIRIPKPERDRILFDRKATGAQFSDEMLTNSLMQDETRKQREAALSEFLEG